MLWYLLYPLRGTKDPPYPSSESIVRRAFYRHGALISRYWLPIMLTAVTTGVFFSYPAVFMSDFRIGKVDTLPHHVWTGSASFESHTEKQPDLEMRQIWLRGDYMRALNTSVLSEVFYLEQELLKGSDVAEPKDWTIHSPALFWQHSLESLHADSDPLNTINDFRDEAAFYQLNLWPLSVFAGKAFRNSRLVAADALVLTLLSRQNDSIASVWDDNLKSLSANDTQSSWIVQAQGNTTDSEDIYEYRFQPFSINQYWALVGAYVCMVVYTAASLRRLKAFKSRFGVVMTAITQMTTSVLASFTICGLLGINLAQIPQEAYPFVVLVIGLENIFRLINAILAYPPEMDTTQRVANGLGDTGIASSISAAQNLAILWVLSQVVSPGVAAFCAFAAIALLFDYFYLLTFFVAVLSVDIRRMELQDSLSRPRGASRRRKRPVERQSFLDGLLLGNVPVSTRMAGSAITIAFVLLLNWHLSDNNVSFFGISPWSSPSTKQYLPSFGGEQTQTPLLNRSSSYWNRTQNTSAAAAQFMHVVKPGVTSFTARVFDPVVVVLAGADRTGIPPAQDSWLLAVRDLATHHFYPFALAVVFVVASVTVLMSILLWEWEERTDMADLDADEGPISCKTIQADHMLDIEVMTSSPSGSILSVGIDRTLSLAMRNTATKAFDKMAVSVSDTLTDVATRTGGRRIEWPVDACALDARAEHMAVQCRDGPMLLGKTNDAALTNATAGGGDQAPLIFEYVALTGKSGTESVLLTLYRNGTLVELHGRRGTPLAKHIASEENGIAAAVIHTRDGQEPKIIILTNLGSVLQYCWQPQSQSWEPLEMPNGITRPSIPARDARGAWLVSAPALDIFLLCSHDEAHIVNARTLQAGHILHYHAMEPHTLRILHSEPYQVPGYDLPACTTLCIAHTASDTLHIETWESSPTPICPASLDPSLPNPLSLQHRSTRVSLANPGKYLPTASLAVAGVRPLPQAPRHTPTNGSLRRRRLSPQKEEQGWQAYSFSHQGELLTLPVKEEGGLSAYTLGPAVKLGQNGVGIALGNAIVAVEVRGSFIGEKDVPLVRRSGSRKRNGVRLGRGRDN